LPAISPDGKSLAYVTEQFGTDKTLVTQLVSGGPTLRIATATDFWQPTWSPDSSELAVPFLQAPDNGWRLYVISRLGGVPRLLGDDLSHCWSQDGSQILTVPARSTHNWAWVSKATGEAKEMRFPKYDYVNGIDCSIRTGKVLVLTSTSKKNQIWTMKPDGAEQQKMIEDENEIQSPRWSANGDSIYFFRPSAETTDLMKLSASSPGSEPSILVSGLESGKSFTVSADGSRLAYTRFRSWANLWSSALPRSGTTTNVRLKALTSGTVTMSFPSISPDGRWVVFLDESGAHRNIFKMAIDGNDEAELTFFDAADASSPAWSPDGRQIAFTCDQGGKRKVWVVNADGTGAHSLDKTDPSETNQWLSWYPSRDIVYLRPGGRNLGRVNAETQEESPVLAAEVEGWLVSRPIFSPDGKAFAIFWSRSWNDSVQGIWVVGDRSERLVYPGEHVPLGWSPDGKSIYAISGGRVLQIFLADPKKTRSVITTDKQLWSYSGAVSPDGSKIIFNVAENKSDVWIMQNFDPTASASQGAFH
jgi:TolB protein